MNIINRIIQYIQKEYKVKPEYPWRTSPRNMVFKSAENGKWFALIFPVNGEKLGLGDTDEIYLLNIKADPDFISIISNTPGYRFAYHMNKKHWISVFLDGSVTMDRILSGIDRSYELITDSPSKRIYEAVKKIPKGCVATYGQVAELAGDRKMARAVGNALHKNPDPDNIPCFRVVNAKGELSGEFAFGGAGAQAKLLEAEGVEVRGGRVDLKKYAWKYDFET